jgi:hypothetical protein
MQLLIQPPARQSLGVLFHPCFAEGYQIRLNIGPQAIGWSLHRRLRLL